MIESTLSSLPENRVAIPQQQLTATGCVLCGGPAEPRKLTFTSITSLDEVQEAKLAVPLCGHDWRQFQQASWPAYGGAVAMFLLGFGLLYLGIRTDFVESTLGEVVTVCLGAGALLVALLFLTNIRNMLRPFRVDLHEGYQALIFVFRDPQHARRFHQANARLSAPPEGSRPSRGAPPSGRQARPSGRAVRAAGPPKAAAPVAPAGGRQATLLQAAGPSDLGDAPAAVLALLPLAGDPSQEQTGAAAEALGVIAYEARRALTSGLPRLERTGSAEAMQAAAERLLQAGVPCICLEPALLADPGAFRVRAIERVEGGLRCLGTDREGGDGERRIDPTEPALLVPACYQYVGKGRLSVSRKGQTKREADEVARVFVGLLFLRDDPVPLAIHEPDIMDYEPILKKRFTGSQHQNFMTLLEMLASPKATDRIDILLTKRDLITSQPFGRFGIPEPIEAAGRRPSPTSGESKMAGSNAYTVDVLARLLYLDWKANRMRSE